MVGTKVHTGGDDRPTARCFAESWLIFGQAGLTAGAEGCSSGDARKRTRLPFPEITGEMFLLSPNTTKAEASSVCRKLGASSAATRSGGRESWAPQCLEADRAVPPCLGDAIVGRAR